MTELFKINFLLVDDSPKSVQNDIDDVFEKLEDDGYDPTLMVQKTTNGIIELIRDKKIDIALVDKNIESDDDGIELVRKIRSEFAHVDILIYSAHKHDATQLKTLCEYAHIEIVEGKDIVTRLDELLEKNISRWEDMHYLRGMVISRIIELELDINEFIAKYFSQQKNPIFYNIILENRNFSFEGKKAALQKIVKRHEDKEFTFASKLDELQCYRNQLAHCRAKPGERNMIVSMGGERVITRVDIHKIFNKAECFARELEQFERRITSKL